MAVTMDMSPMKKDIDELIDEFAQGESTSFSDMKRVWASKKFTLIYDATPNPGYSSASNVAFFMQSLFAHCLGNYVASSLSLSHRLGGFYCLYCLHELQPIKPHYMIYICLRDLKNIKELVTAAKERGIAVVLTIIKRMLERNMFLFGAVDVNEISFTERINHLTGLQNARVQFAYEKLFATTPIERVLHMDMGLEEDIKNIDKMLSEYAESKTLAIEEGRPFVDVQDLEHTIKVKSQYRNAVEEIAEEWIIEREKFYGKTGLSLPSMDKEQLPLPSSEGDDHLDYEHELERLLSRGSKKNGSPRSIEDQLPQPYGQADDLDFELELEDILSECSEQNGSPHFEDEQLRPPLEQEDDIHFEFELEDILSEDNE
ncbi:hypothetical protein SAY87_000775 [Trapa incisa]|uniref:Uncharacterized protein n=1 Tax=Trapa incisa TaxID=236973 RepID=A0AAN7GJF5_9MYRT|nr:hypothetical protein SAY87_000775 [Trapa incisa]